MQLPCHVVAIIAQHDVHGWMRGVCQAFKEEWDRQHLETSFRYDMLAKQRHRSSAGVVMAFLADVRKQSRANSCLWSVPVMPKDMEYMQNMLLHTCLAKVAFDPNGGTAHMYMRHEENGVKLEITQTDKHSRTRQIVSQIEPRLDVLVVRNVSAMLRREQMGRTRNEMARLESLDRLRALGFATTCLRGIRYPSRPATMPPTMEHDKAVSLIDNPATLKKVADLFPGSVVFEETDTLGHVNVEGRLLVCVYDKDGNNKTPVDPTKKFHATDVVAGVAIDRMFMGPKTVCKEISSTTSKQTAYVQAMQGSSTSEKFIKELFRVYDHEVYADAVEAHPMHRIKQTALCKNNDGKKAIMALSRKGKLFTPIAEDDDGNKRDFVARRKVFGTRHQYKKTGTDFDRREIEEFCEENASKSRTGHLCVDLVPTFFLDGSKCTDYNSIRSSSAAIIVVSLRPCWTNDTLGNVSWGNQLEYMQLFTVGMARSADAAIDAPNFLAVEPKPESVDFTADADAASETEEDEVDSFVAKRRKLAE